MEQIENVVLGPKYALRLADLASWHRLRAVCFRCSRSAILRPDVLRRRFSGDTRLVYLQGKLRCTACGNRTNNTMSVGKLARN